MRSVNCDQFISITLSCRDNLEFGEINLLMPIHQKQFVNILLAHNYCLTTIVTDKAMVTYRQFLFVAQRQQHAAHYMQCCAVHARRTSIKMSHTTCLPSANEYFGTVPVHDQTCISFDLASILSFVLMS